MATCHFFNRLLLLDHCADLPHPKRVRPLCVVPHPLSLSLPPTISAYPRLAGDRGRDRVLRGPIAVRFLLMDRHDPKALNECDDPCDPPPPAPHSGHPTNFIIIAAAIFAASLLLCIIYYTVLRRRRRFPAAAAAVTLEEGDASSLGDAEPIHHVWYIRTVGLDESTIASIAVAEYVAGDGLLDGVSDCSVCLGEFRDGERVRLLPKCDHAFHVPCIDTWLRAHANCPLCRAHIVDPDAEPALQEATHVALPITAAGESVDMDSGSTVSAEAAPIGTLAPEEEAEQNIVPETTIETAIQVGPSIVLDSPPESPLSGDQSHMTDNELQPVRRSFSMDAPLTNAIIVAVEEENDAIFAQESRPKNTGKLGSSSKGLLDQKAHSGVGRSLSSSGRGFFFSRPGRAARIHSMPLTSAGGICGS